MPHTLITFLGRGQRSDNGDREARYRLDAQATCTTSFFGIGLARHLDLDRVVVLGTAGSIWDVFAFDNADGAMDDAQFERLCDAVKTETVTQALLDEIKPALKGAAGTHVIPVLIPYARSQSEQIDILDAINHWVEPGSRVTIDVTHGFRHLPMLGLVAARYLQRVKQARIEAILYGALDMTDTATGETPVLDLSGLSHLLDWVEALAAYDASGDYGSFAPLLDQGTGATSIAERMRLAAFRERTSNPTQARQELLGLLSGPLSQPAATAAGKLFLPALSERLDWAKRPRRHEWELELADAYLERRDYLRAVIYLFESLITREAERLKSDINDYVARKEAQESLKKASSKEEFKRLDRLRNALAHGLRSSDKRVAALLADEAKLQVEIARLRNEFLN